MTHLLDINMLIALGWTTSPDHLRAKTWANQQGGFATAPTVQVAFMRVSMSPAFGASFEDASAVLASVLVCWQHRFVSDVTSVADLPCVNGHKEIHDAHLVVLAKQHGLKLATLDRALCSKSWAQHTAVYVENPGVSSK